MHLTHWLGVVAALSFGCTDGGPPTMQAQGEPSVRKQGGAAGGGAGGGSGGGSGIDRIDYQLTLSSFPSAYDGRLVRLKVRSELGFEGKTSGRLEGGKVQLLVRDVVESQEQLTIDYFLDMNEDGACSPCGYAPQDTAWRRTRLGAPPVTSDSFTYDTKFTDISPF